MLRPGIAAAVCLSVAAAPATAQDWAQVRRVEVKLSSFAFTPSTLHLRAGQPVLLHLVNSASGGHDFTAPRFFAAAEIRPSDRSKVDEEGDVDLKGHQSVDIALTPKAGRYPLKCSHAFHKMFGMSGEIVVD